MKRPAAANRESFRAFVSLQTRWADNDEYGHMNNATYLSLFDTALSLWQMQNGLDIRGPQALRFLVVESGCKYHAEIGFPDALTAGLRLAHLGTSSYRVEIGLFRGDSAQAAAEGFFAQVLVDNSTASPRPIPDAVRKTLSQLLPVT
ncbi:MAG: acyl-CoA thioesterase [Pelagimonas sp.]|uniref:acyl-CoA thioesterase n=1 Tax=Pelagimonas sp. TaxID=2073170 RepID=UPI003D6A842B